MSATRPPRIRIGADQEARLRAHSAATGQTATQVINELVLTLGQPGDFVPVERLFWSEERALIRGGVETDEARQLYYRPIRPAEEVATGT